MKIVKIVTHDGIFHADEFFALAVLKLYFDKENSEVQIIRSRDVEIISNCDICVDVGGEYNELSNKYDHHQKNKPNARENGIPYASFGLIWKHFGMKLTSDDLVWNAVEKKLVMPIDAVDNGVNISNQIIKGVNEYGISQVISAISKAFDEKSIDSAFGSAVDVANLILFGEIKKAEAKIEGEKEVTKIIIDHREPEVLVLDGYLNWETAVSKYKNIKLVVYPDKDPSRWCIQAARDNLEVFGKDRISFPESWRGLSNEELVSISGIPNSSFCHVGGFFAVAKTKQAAIDLAKKAVALQS